jgi:CubicO group peptidase (beta-lactamase class C family)
VEALRQVADWPARTAAAGVVSATDELGTVGARDVVLPWASVTKLLTGLAALVALEEGTVDLDEPVGPPGSTLRHVLSHASGLPLNEGPPLARVGQRRIYSNAGIQAAADAVERGAEMPFRDYLHRAVLQPLGLVGELGTSPAWGYAGPLEDLLVLARELLAPTLVAAETFAEATSVQFPGLVGVLPSFGRMEPNDWGLAFEVRGTKSPHWTGSANSAATFGHFGASGTFLWVDPEAGIACAALTDLEFGDWAKDAWPRLADAVLTEVS